MSRAAKPVPSGRVSATCKKCKGKGKVVAKGKDKKPIVLPGGELKMITCRGGCKGTGAVWIKG